MSEETWLKVCVTCNDDTSAALADTVAAGLRRRGFSQALQLRRSQCLATCQHPGAVVFGAIGKCKLRFNDIACTDVEAILDLAEAYLQSANGEPDLSQWPENLRKRLVAVVRS